MENSKTTSYIVLIILFTFLSSLSYSQWQDDRKYKFKINIPDNWNKTSYMDGTDKVYDYYSADQNLAIQMRVFELTGNVSTEILAKLYEDNMLPVGIQKQKLIDYTTVNNIKGKQGTYFMDYNGNQVVMNSFYTVQHNIAYIITAIIPMNLIEQKGEELKNVTQSFIIDGFETVANVSSTDLNQTGSGSVYNESANQYSHTSNEGGLSVEASSSIQINKLEIGNELDSNHGVIEPKITIPANTSRLNLVFDYSGNANGKLLLVKWYSDTYQCLITEAEYFPVHSDYSRGYAYIENNNKPWPLGDYRAEIWHSGQKIQEKTFTVINQKNAQASEGILLGKIFADGTGDNRTKSKGGKYLGVDLNKLKDDDIIEVRITSGDLKFVHVHLRNSRGVWYSKYEGMNTRFKVKDLITNQRSNYTHINFNVNGKHEKYLPVACYAEVWHIPTNESAIAESQNNQQTISSNSIKRDDLVGRYNFTHRSDGKVLVNYHYIIINENGTYVEKYNPKDSGDYVGGNEGKWKFDGKFLTLHINYSNVIDTYSVKDNFISRTTDGGLVFTFKKQ